MLTYHQYRSSGIHLKAILQEIPQPSVTEISLKITYLKFYPNLPGANELTYDFTQRGKLLNWCTGLTNTFNQNTYRQWRYNLSIFWKILLVMFFNQVMQPANLQILWHTWPLPWSILLQKSIFINLRSYQVHSEGLMLEEWLKGADDELHLSIRELKSSWLRLDRILQKG